MPSSSSSDTDAAAKGRLAQVAAHLQPLETVARLSAGKWVSSEFIMVSLAEKDMRGEEMSGVEWVWVWVWDFLGVNELSLL